MRHSRLKVSMFLCNGCACLTGVLFQFLQEDAAAFLQHFLEHAAQSPAGEYVFM
jgi:hypothetical protein